MASCSKCAAPLPEGAVYCPACGKKQTSTPARKALKRANGMGTVYKLQGRRKRPWVAARNKLIIGYYPSKTEALEALEQLSGQKLTWRYNLTFSEVYEEWQKEHFRKLGPDGKAQYERAYDVFAPLHDRKFRELRTADFQAVIDRHMNKSHSTVSKHKQLITQMSKWAIREGLITTDLASFVQLPEAIKKEKQIFTDDEIRRIEADGSEESRIVCMLLATGMRIGELFHLKLTDYHGNYVIGGSKTDAGRNRVIPIRPEGKAHFAYFAEQSAGKERLLDGYHGNHDPANFRGREYKTLLKRLGIDQAKTPHATRHTYTTRAVKESLSPEVLQKVLGHTDYSTTANIYTHIAPEDLVKAVNATATNTLLTEEKTVEK
jgi:integrase